MEQQLPRSSFDRGAKNAMSFLVSMIFHVLVLLALACWVMVAGRPSKGVTTLSFSADSADLVVSLSETPSLDLETNAQSSFEPLANKSLLEFSANNAVLESALGTDLTADKLPSSPTSLTSVSDGLQSGTGRGATFFGTYASGGKFVYVVDSSQSMKGERWRIARAKLLESLRQLQRDQEFFVICFDEHTSLLFNCQPSEIEFKRVNEVAIERTSRWLRSRTLGPATMPAGALEVALMMAPDAIFILSDGELQDNTVQLMRMLNVEQTAHKKIPIHAIHLISAQGMDTLLQLSKENGGTFKHVEK